MPSLLGTPLLVVLTLLVVGGSECVASEKHVEYVLGAHVLAVALVPLTTSARSLVLAWFFARQVVNPSFFWVSEAGVGLADFFEGFGSLWRMVLIRVELNCELLVSPFDFVFSRLRGKS